MICLFSAFCSGLCSAATIYSFTNGNIGIGAMNLGLALINAVIAMFNYIGRR